MNNEVYREIKKKLQRAYILDWKQVMLKLEMLKEHDSVTYTAKRWHSATSSHVPIELHLERLGETTYTVNGERFGPKTLVEKFLDATDGS